jgi:hypothetical protein
LDIVSVQEEYRVESYTHFLPYNLLLSTFYPIGEICSEQSQSREEFWGKEPLYNFFPEPGSIDWFDFMLYPRVSALAEAGWTAASKKNYKDFAPRLQKMLNYYEDLKLHYYDPFNPEKNSEPAGVKKPQVKIASK